MDQLPASLRPGPPGPPSASRQAVREHSERSFSEASCWFSAARRAGSHRGVPGASVGKNPPQCRRPGSAPGMGRPPGKGNGNPLQYSCLEEPGRLPSMGSQELDTTVVSQTSPSPPRTHPEPTSPLSTSICISIPADALVS